MDMLTLVGVGGVVALLGFALLVAFVLRRVVPTNEVHIVQSAKSTTSYGKSTGNGNTYYEWPSFLPIFGVTKVVLPVSVFDLDLEAYEAYDKGRLPFVVDVKAFFRISDSNVAAQSVSSFAELLTQLQAIVQGAVRVILATNDIETILQGRSAFGEQFTKEVNEQLSNWGVSTVKNIELMDIRDHKESKVIANIMEKKKSHIEMESRTEVAKNKQAAAIAEIEAKREIDLNDQIAKQAVGLRTTENEREVLLAKQKMEQAIKEQEKITKEKEMSILNVQELRTAEINREVSVVKAEQEKQTFIIKAEGEKSTLTLKAEGALEAKRREAEGIALEGKARADAERAMLLAPVEAQTTLAKEIGNNEGYQKYLVTIRQLEANQTVGVEQAKALGHAEIKIIANTGGPSTVLSSAMDLFSSQGGTAVGAMLEGLAQTDKGAALLNRVVPEPVATKAATPAKASNGARA